MLLPRSSSLKARSVALVHSTHCSGPRGELVPSDGWRVGKLPPNHAAANYGTPIHAAATPATPATEGHGEGVESPSLLSGSQDVNTGPLFVL